MDRECPRGQEEFVSSGGNREHSGEVCAWGAVEALVSSGGVRVTVSRRIRAYAACREAREKWMPVSSETTREHLNMLVSSLHRRSHGRS